MGQKSEVATLEAAQKMGELLLQIQKASGGVNQYNKEEKSAITEKSKTGIIVNFC